MRDNQRRTGLRRAAGLMFVAIASLLTIVCGSVTFVEPPGSPTESAARGEQASFQAGTQEAVPTFTAAAPPADGGATPSVEGLAQSQPELVELYNAVSPGVVNIQVFVNNGQGAEVGAGSGFVLDGGGDIITNNHVVADAETVTVVFFDGTEAAADIVGTDPDSDLAVVRVGSLPEGVHALSLGDSQSVQVGEWVVAIGNPFGLGTSMSIGIVSAIGRAIESGATPFRIPEAIQTDAAINPGNSGGPLLNLAGEVVGVNAQIATAGVAANSGVGFAIPANVVRRVTPVLIASGAYQWPWLGVEGDDVNLLIAEANNLNSQAGAYIHNVVPGGPAEAAGLRGSANTGVVDGIEVPVGGDIVIEADGQPVNSFNELLTVIAAHHPGEEVALTVLRDGQPQQIAVTLDARPESFSGPEQILP
jgi:2-alkenal reductase